MHRSNPSLQVGSCRLSKNPQLADIYLPGRDLGKCLQFDGPHKAQDGKTAKQTWMIYRNSIRVSKRT